MTQVAKISSITRRQNRYLPSDARSLDVKLRVKWTCVAQSDICRFRTRGDTADFQSQNELSKIKISTAACWSRVSEHPMESLCWVLHVKKYSMRLSDSRFCPRIGALMIHVGTPHTCGIPWATGLFGYYLCRKAWNLHLLNDWCQLKWPLLMYTLRTLQ